MVEDNLFYQSVLGECYLANFEEADFYSETVVIFFIILSRKIVLNLTKIALQRSNCFLKCVMF